MSDPEERPIVVAEIGSVHDGSFGNAIKLIELAKACGADYVKFQTHLPQHESKIDAPNPSFFDGENRYDYFQRTSFTPEQWGTLADVALETEIGFMSSVFSVEAINLLIDAGVRHVKVPSGEVTNLRLLQEIARHKLPTFLSTGMSDWAEIDTAVRILKDLPHMTLMQCTSIYPTGLDQVGLNIVSDMKARYPFRIGFSDHTEGIEAAILALAKGARVFEKHLTFSRHMYGSDAHLAREPDEFRAYVSSIRSAHELLESRVDKDDLSPFAETRRVFMKSLYYAMDLPSGTVLEHRHIVDLKPKEGISSSEFSAVIGKAVKNSVTKHQPVSWEDF